MAAPTVLVQADLSGTAFGGTPTWTDITSYVLTTDSGQPISITLGRQDQTTDVVPSTCSFVLINDDGRFTPDRSSSPYYPHVLPGVRVRVSLTVSGTTYRRFDGYVDSWQQTYEGGGPSSLVAVSCVDILARFGTTTSLLSEEILADSPAAFYPLDEVAGSSSAGNLSNTGQASLVPKQSKNGGGDYSFGTGTAVAGDPGGAALVLNSTLTSTSTDDLRGYYLAGPSAPSLSGAFTFEAWVTINPTLPTAMARNTNPVPIFGFVAPSGYLVGALGLFRDSTTGHIWPSMSFTEPGGSIMVPLSWTGDLNDGKAHHIAFTSSGSGGSYAFYVDGASVASGGSGAGTMSSTTGASTVAGGRPLNGIYSAPLFRGTLQFAAAYSAALSSARIAAHYYAGGATATAESTNARVTRLLSYRANTGSSIATGLGSAGTVDLTGTTLQQALLDTATVEGGYLYVNGSGLVVMLARTAQYNPASSLTLNSSLEQVEADSTFRSDTQLLANDVTVSRPDGATQRVADTTSQSTYGVRSAALSVPFATDADALQAAYWLLGNRKDVKVRTPNLTVNLYAEPTASVVQNCLAITPWQRITVTNLPATAPAATVDVLVQGWTEGIAADSWTLSYYTSRLPLNVVIADGVGTADSTTYVAAW